MSCYLHSPRLAQTTHVITFSPTDGFKLNDSRFEGKGKELKLLPVESFASMGLN